MTETDWTQFRCQCAADCLCALIETTEHPVLETELVKDAYAASALSYADALITLLKKNPPIGKIDKTALKAMIEKIKDV